MKIILQKEGLEIIQIDEKKYRVETLRKSKNPSIDTKIKALIELLKLLKQKSRYMPMLEPARTKHWSLNAIMQ